MRVADSKILAKAKRAIARGRSSPWPRLKSGEFTLALAQPLTPAEAVNHNAVRGRELAGPFHKLPHIQTPCVQMMQSGIET